MPSANLVFNYKATDTQVAVIRKLQGQSGQLHAHWVTVTSLERAGDHIVLCGQTENGEILHQEVLEKLMSFPVSQINDLEGANTGFNPLSDELNRRKTEILLDVNQRNLKYLEAEADKLDGWADDLKVGLEQEIKDLDKEIREVRRSAKATPDLNGKLEYQKRQRELEKLRSRERRELFDKQDKVDARREELTSELEGKMEKKVEEKPLFAIGWRVY